MSEVSELPWSIEPYAHDDPYGPIRIADAKGNDIGELWIDDAPVEDFNEMQQANAAYIVQAANAFPALVALLRRALRIADDIDCVPDEMVHAFIADAKATLAQARGQDQHSDIVKDLKS